MSPRFDAAYFARRYGEGDVHGPREIAHLGQFIVSFAAWARFPLKTVLDAGAGPGFFRDWAVARGLRVRSIDFSADACRLFGHERRDLSKWRARSKFDLVVCHGVLQFLADEACKRAIGNLGAMSRGLLYLEVLTREDVRIADEKSTDLDVHLRSAAWYRRELGKHFVQIGAGLWASRNSPLVFWSLEKA
jgi:hypothetical protein